MSDTLAYDLFLILAAGLLACLVCRRLHLSSLIGYLLTGIVIGKGGLGLVMDANHEIEHLAELGVFLLLFTIGLEFSLDDLQRLGKSMLIGGSLQMLLVACPVTIGLGLLGLPWRAAGLVGAAVAFSSTVLVFNALAEHGHTNRPHGRQAIAILLFQDAALIPLLLLVPLLTGAGQVAHWSDYLRLTVTSILFVASIIALRRLLSAHIVPWFASSRSLELIILFTLVALGGITLAAHAVQLPPAVGAFAAGLIFSGNRWTPQIDAIMLPLRGAFSAIFFVSLGMLVRPGLVLEAPIELVVMFAALMLLKTFAAMMALRVTGQSWRASLGMGMGLAQVGEFAFVLTLLGVEAELLGTQTYERIVLLAIASLTVTPLLIRWGVRWVDETESEAESEHPGKPGAGHVVVVGAGPIGKSVIQRLHGAGEDACLIDLSPVNLHEFDQLGVRTIAGDASDPSILSLAGVEQAKMVVVSVPDDGIANNIVEQVRATNSSALLVVRCRYRESMKVLRKAGADRIVSEEEQASLALQQAL